MAQQLPEEILEKIFLKLSWNNLRICQNVCQSWNTLIEYMKKVHKFEEIIEENLWYHGDPRIEETFIKIPREGKFLFTGHGVTLISEMSHVRVVDMSVDNIWILKTEGIVSGQATEDIIVIERFNYHKDSNTLEIWSRINRNRIGNIELETEMRTGVYKCWKSRVMVFNKIKAQFTYVKVNTRDGTIIEKIHYNITDPYDLGHCYPVEKVEASSPSKIMLKYFRKKFIPSLVLFHVEETDQKMIRMPPRLSIYKPQNRHLKVLQVLISDHFFITMSLDDEATYHYRDDYGYLIMSIHDQRRKRETEVVNFRANIDPTKSYSPENCLLACQDGKLICTVDTTRIFLFNMESISRAYPETKIDHYDNIVRFDRSPPSLSFDELMDKNRSKIKSKILKVNMKRPGNFYSSHINVDKTSITILNFHKVEGIKVKKINF